MSAPHPLLVAAADAAGRAYRDAASRYTPAQLATTAMEGADGTPAMLVDVLVEDAIIEVVTGSGANVLSEERGFVDTGSAVTVVVDPVDGSANAAAGVPLHCFSAALAVDEVFTDALTRWLHTGEQWYVRGGEPAYRTSGRTRLDGASLSLLRPRPENREAWSTLAARASRVRVLGCSTLDAAFVATGAVDAFADVGSDTHRLVDLAAAALIVPASGGAVVDVQGRPVVFDTDLRRRWSGVVAATPALADSLATAIAELLPAVVHR